MFVSAAQINSAWQCLAAVGSVGQLAGLAGWREWAERGLMSWMGFSGPAGFGFEVLSFLKDGPKEQRDMAVSWLSIS